MPNQTDAVPITSAPFPFRLSGEQNKKKVREKTEKGRKKKSQIDPATLHRYYRASAVLRGFTSSSGRDSRAEFLTTARILSLGGQLVVGISRERIDFSSHRPSRSRCISIPIHRHRFPSSPHFLFFVLPRLLFRLHRGFHLTYHLYSSRTHSVRRRIFFFAPLYNAQPFALLYSRAESL